MAKRSSSEPTFPETITEAQTWAHPDTGEKVEIPAGSTLVRVGDTVETIVGPIPVGAEGADGEILHWQLPPEIPEGALHKDQVEAYEPRVDRSGLARRVLQHVTDEDHVGRGPRNTPERLAIELAEDPHTPDAGVEVVPGRWAPTDQDLPRVVDRLERLARAGLVERRDDGTYAVTDDGRVELAN